MTKQSTRPGIVHTLLQLALITTGMDSVNHTNHAHTLLTNGYRAPLPGKMLNQRQKRKDIRRTS